MPQALPVPQKVIALSKEVSVLNLTKAKECLVSVKNHTVYRGEMGGLVLTPWDSLLCSYLSLPFVANPYVLFPCDVWV